jgi:antitoxin component YwqK of YwqJK toxin-antitoxin module
MEVDFMVQQERLRNSGLMILVMFVTGCGGSHRTAPGVSVDESKHKFETSGGITYMDSRIFSGYRFALYDNKDTALCVPFYEGKEEGIARSWYENRQLRDERIYTLGRKEGTHRGWWPSGERRFIYHFSHDMYEGEVTDWFANGKLFRSFHYSDGQEHGIQRQFFAEGSLQFNYEARNGRQYGLTGIKNCVNVTDSVQIN